MVPTVHSNGTSRDVLLQQLCDAGIAVALAMRALGDAAPNGRDYYPQGPDAIRTATAEHVARVAALGKVHDELAALAEEVAS